MTCKAFLLERLQEATGTVVQRAPGAGNSLLGGGWYAHQLCERSTPWVQTAS